MDPSNDTPRSPAAGRALAWAALALLALLAIQALAIERTRIHWDEFALLHLADLTVARGELQAGGRPGLAVALLVPLVEHCRDELAVMHDARWLWLGITGFFLAGLWYWLAQLAPERRAFTATLGVALLALPPAFLDASLQVRTDQIALAGGAWGGALLLASRRRPWLGLLAGIGFGIGLLGSQKVLYIGALAGLVAAGDLFVHRALRPTRELLRVLVTAAGMAGVLLAFRLWAEASFVVDAAAPVKQPLTRDFVARGFSLFDFYRQTIGWSEYRAMLPELVPHTLFGLALATATLDAWRRKSLDAGRLVLASAVLGLGVGVALFHAAAFRYFWLTLGVFPAIAFALARAPLAARIPPRLRTLTATAMLVLLALPAGLHVTLQLADTQRVQRESLDFVHRNFSPEVTGFHPESALFCQAGEQPLPTYFSQHIYQSFEGPRRERNIVWLKERFREERVAFLLESFRLKQFPEELRRFWEANYQPYRGSVFVAGRRLAGARGESAEFELLVPGPYRWLPLDGEKALEIAGRRVEAGGVVELPEGVHRAAFVEDVDRGVLLLALAERPGDAPLPFYP